MAKKDQAKKNASSRGEGFKAYVKGIKTEISKVVWPTRKELGTFTGVVIATCAIFALGFWLIDSGVLLALRTVLGITLN